MPEDRSLDDFAEADAAGDESRETETEADDSEGDAADPADATDPAGTTDPAEVDPATATSTWHADGAACDRCGDRVQRRWRDDDIFVCADCVSW